MRRPLLTSAFLAALLAFTGAAAAQPTPNEADIDLEVRMGKVLLDDGKALLQDGHFEQALDKLKTSVVIDPTPEALLELGGCQEKLRATASASGTFHRAAERARLLGDTAHVAEAEARAVALEHRLSRVRVVVTSSETKPDVTIDDRWLPRSAWGVPFPLDPGTHRLTALSAATQTFSVTFTVAAEGGIKEILVPALLPYSPDVPLWARTAPRSPTAERLQRAGLALAIVGGSSLAVGLGLLIGPGKNTDAILIAAASFGGVGVVSGCAAVPFFIVGSKMAQTVRAPLPLQVGPMVARSGGGLTIHGAF